MAGIEIRGVKELITKLGRVEGFRILKAPMQRGTERLRGRMAKYPPQRPTKYRRTGTLGRRWTTEVEVSGDSLVGIIGNNTRYGPFVQDATRQARWHQRHWPTDEQVAREEEGAIVRDFDKTIDEALK